MKPSTLPVELVDALAAAGLDAGPDGYSAPDVAAAAEARGLRWSVEEGSRLGGEAARRTRFTAVVWDPTPVPPADSLTVVRRATRARGRTEGEALARALGAWLIRHA